MLSVKKRVKKVAALAFIASISITSLLPINVLAANATDVYQQRFETMYKNIKDPANGYFNSQGIPYHSVETFMIEAPDYGHESTSEAFSYNIWLEAMAGKFSGDFNGFKQSWDVAEKYIIPSHQDQPSMSKYDANKPATYAPEYELPSKYPARLDTGAAVGRDPIDNELKSAYNNSDMYGMHWIMDVDNWYGFGQRADGTSKPSLMNTFQRGVQESVFETVPQPCWDALKFGGRNGYLDLFAGDNSYAQQFKYTDAPDADARAIQATYYASKWAKEYNVDLSSNVSQASKMGDYLRYSFYDKYFRKIGSSTTPGNGNEASSNLLSWYYAWGGDASSEHSWSWKIGSSHVHFGYQNPVAAWVLSTDSNFKPKSNNGAKDWEASLTRQIEFYTWLQSSEGAIAGGASNSNNGRYEAWPAGTSTFYGMGYQANPVYEDPGSNTWFGMQVWSMQRVAQYYYESKDNKAKALLDKWAKWANSEIKLKTDGTFEIPSTIDWQGQPDTWNGNSTGNPNLHVKVVNYGTDLGTASSFANTLAYYAAATGDKTSQDNAKELLDRIWNKYKDSKGISIPESRKDYSRIFTQEVYIPSGWTGKMPNGDEIKSGIKFIDIRSKYKNDPDYAKVKKAIDDGKAPTFNYHRFWAQSEFAIANGTYAILFSPSGSKNNTKKDDNSDNNKDGNKNDLNSTDGAVKGDINSDGKVNIIDYVLLKRYVLNDSIKIDINVADISGDSKINVIDCIQLGKLILK